METAAAVDPYELLEAVEVLSKMPKDFYEKIVSWYNYYQGCSLLPSASFADPSLT